MTTVEVTMPHNQDDMMGVGLTGDKGPVLVVPAVFVVVQCFGCMGVTMGRHQFVYSWQFNPCKNSKQSGA
jgi:hypothetical protein